MPNPTWVIAGVPEKLDTQQLEGKPQWVTIFQDATAIIDSSGCCLFTFFAFGGPADYTDLINAATGFDMTPEDVMTVGERIWNLERKFNIEAGISPEEIYQVVAMAAGSLCLPSTVAVFTWVQDILGTE